MKHDRGRSQTIVRSLVVTEKMIDGDKVHRLCRDQLESILEGVRLQEFGLDVEASEHPLQHLGLHPTR